MSAERWHLADSDGDPQCGAIDACDTLSDPENIEHAARAHGRICTACADSTWGGGITSTPHTERERHVTKKEELMDLRVRAAQRVCDTLKIHGAFATDVAGAYVQTRTRKVLRALCGVPEPVKRARATVSTVAVSTVGGGVDEIREDEP
jgi:hypothetical protein